MAEIAAIHRLRGFQGRSAFEFDVQIGTAAATFYWRDRDQAWLPMNAFGQSIPAARIAKVAGIPEGQAAAEIEAAAQLCEREYLLLDPPALHLVA